MPRPKTQNSVPQLSAGQASYVLDRLVSDRRVSPGEITRYVGEMHREISDLEQRLQSLRHAAGAAISTALSKVGVGSAPRPARRRGRPAGSGKAAAAAATPAATGAVKRGPGRPPGSGAAKRGPGRPRGSAKAAAPAASAASAQSSAPAAPAKRGRKRRSAITPEQLASRQLQGRYLGLIRQVPASKRAQYQKIAKEKGREAAIRELQDAVKK